MSRGLVALLLVATLVVSGVSSALISWAVTTSVVGTHANGEAGADGHAGADGVDGADGEQGAAGSTGATGPRGATGATGAAGAGTAGAPGAHGAQGPQGEPGQAGADAVIASAEMTTPDTSLVFDPGAWNEIGTPLAVDAAKVVLLSWQVTVEPLISAGYISCAVLDTVTNRSYGTYALHVSPGTPDTFQSSAVVNISEGDAVMALVCMHHEMTSLPWQVSGAALYSLTLI